jgi:hypothetical protein
MRYRFIGKALVVALIGLSSISVAGCNDSPSPVQATVTTPTGTVASNCPSTGTPSISILPKHGKPGTLVTVIGSGFPAGCPVEIRLSSENSGATTQVYASTEASASTGYVQASFRMPDRWPNGESIVIPQVLIVAATPDFLEKATTPFAYEAFGTPLVTPTSNGQISHNSNQALFELATDPDCSGRNNLYFDAYVSKFSN